MKCYNINKIRVFKIQREIESRKTENYSQNHGGIFIPGREGYKLF